MKCLFPSFVFHAIFKIRQFANTIYPHDIASANVTVNEPHLLKHLQSCKVTLS